MRYFEKFPKDAKCPLCGTSKDGECFLMPIDGTDDDGICEAAPTHRSCVGDYLTPLLRFNKEVGVIYARSK